MNATETVMAAYRRMKLYDVSQVPVMQDGRIVGIVDEEDILLGVVANPAHFNEPVTSAMASHLVTVPVDAPVAQLMEIFKRGMVAIVMHGTSSRGSSRASTCSTGCAAGVTDAGYPHMSDDQRDSALPRVSSTAGSVPTRSPAR